MELPLDGHTFIAGQTSSGKSAAAKWVFQGSRRACLVVNLQAEEWPGARLHTTRPPTMQQLLAARKCVWTPPDYRTAAKDLEPLVRRLFALGEGIGDRTSIATNRARPWLNVIVDEAHLVAPNAASPGPLERLATQGLRYGIVLTVVTQRPQAASKTVLSQSAQVLLFRVTMPDRQYLEGKLHPIPEPDWEWAQRRYHFLRLNPGTHAGWARHTPLPPP